MRSKSIIIIAAAAVLLFMTVMSCSLAGNRRRAEGPEAAAATEEPHERSLSVTAVGDCTFARDINAAAATGFDTYAERNGTDYFFKNVKGIFDEDDLTIVNLEGTLSTRGERENKQFAFRGDPSYVKILTSSSVEAANLANNHSSDYGAVSLEDTKKYLDEAGILYCRGRDDVSVTEMYGIKVGLVGINYLNDQMKTELEDAISEARGKGAELIILSIHWGVEKATAPNEEQIEAAHRAVDLGADLVIGTHPHVLEGIEKYKGKYICYSLGNFCFGGNSAPSDTDTAIFRIKFTFGADGALLDDDNYEIIPCKISSARGYNDYCPVPAEGGEKDRIESRLTEYSRALGMNTLTFR